MMQPFADLTLASQEQRFQLLVNSIHDYAIYMLDPKGIVSSWNTGAQKFKGYTAEEIIGQHFSVFFTDEDREAALPQRALAIADSEGQFEMEGWRVRKDGTRFWVSAVIDPIRRDDGLLLGFAKVTRDITERREAQEALRRSEEQFRLLVQGVTDYAIITLDPNGIITNWNSGAQRMKGYAAEEIIGRHFSTFYEEEDRLAGLPERALRIAASEGRFETERWRVRKDGTHFWANVVIDPIRGDDGSVIGFAKITRDITERREAQLALDRTREALFQAQKMEAVGQLTGGVAHDFNNLLQAVNGSLELIERRLAAGRTDVGHYASAARNALDRASTLTQRLLAFSRRQSLKPGCTKVSDLVAGMRELIDRSVGEAVQVELLVPPDLWPIWADAHQIESALLNLAINARDAMSEGGRLTIAASNISLDEAFAAGELGVKPGDYVALSVSDTGVGMPPDVLAHAFEPFFTTKPIGRGTGLGLSQIYGFAKQSGGHVRLESAVGKGTTVILYLPRYQGVEAEQFDHTPAPAPQPRTQGEGTVLVVEDEALIRMLLVDALTEQGFTVLDAEDGSAALDIVTSPERIDLLVTDVGLPGINGRQLAEMACSRRPELKVLFLTGYAYNIDGDEEDLGVNSHILNKPVTIDAFIAKVQEIAESRCPSLRCA